MSVSKTSLQKSASDAYHIFIGLGHEKLLLIVKKCYGFGMNQKKAWPRLPTAQECAMLILHMIEARSTDSQPLTRVRISELTLKRLCGRNRLSAEFLEEVQEWLSHGGWSLFFAENTFAAIRSSVVRNWMSVSSKLIADDLDLVQRGEFDFQKYLYRVSNKPSNDSDD
jgi:hypothetical protein